MKSFLGNFYRHFAIFIWSHWSPPTPPIVKCCRMSCQDSQQRLCLLGSGCGSVSRAVASDSWGLQLESINWQKLYWTFTVNCIEKTKIKKNRPGLAHLKKMLFPYVSKISINRFYARSFWWNFCWPLALKMLQSNLKNTYFKSKQTTKCSKMTK